MRTSLILLLCIITFIAKAADEIVLYEQTELPLELSTYPETDALKLHGYAVHYWYGEKMYIGAIYATEAANKLEGLYHEQNSVRMRLHILQDKIDAQTVALIWMDALIVNNSAKDTERYAEHILEFKRAMSRSYRNGDIIDIEYTPNQGMKLYVNKTLQGTWPNRQFFNMTLNTWVGPHPPSREFKRAILNFPVS